MMTDENQIKEISIPVSHALLCLQLIDRVCSLQGGLRPQELSPVGSVRHTLVQLVENETGFNYDQPVKEDENNE